MRVETHTKKTEASTLRARKGGRKRSAAAAPTSFSSFLSFSIHRLFCLLVAKSGKGEGGGEGLHRREWNSRPSSSSQRRERKEMIYDEEGTRGEGRHVVEIG